MKHTLYIFIVFVLPVISCSSDTKPATFTVSTGEFNYSLLVDGVVEPQQSTSVSSPRYCDGTVVFLVEDGTYVEEGQVVCVIEFQQLQNQYDQIIISLENAEAGLNKTKASLNMQFALLEAQVRTNEADTRIAQMDSLQLAFMSLTQKSIKELELERANIDKARYEKKLEALKGIQQSELKKQELEIQRFRINVQSMKDRLDALTLKAPKGGLLIRSDCRLTGTKYQVGDPVWSNMPVATIPDMKEMKVKILASESDFKNINVNDSVCYTFDAMPGNTGTGKILKKAPVGQPYTQSGKVKYFEIEASIGQIDAMPEPGFTANCRIIFKQMENVISVPQIAIFEEDSMKVVFVQRKKGYEKRQILTDLSSPKEAVITAGLTDGEVITLSKPKPSWVKDLVALPDSLIQKPETPVDESKPEAVPPGLPGNVPQNFVQP